jgi:hypothetical protein
MKLGVFRLLLAFILGAFAAPAFGQIVYIDTSLEATNRRLKIKPPKFKAISKEYSAGYRQATDGWSGFFDYGRVLSNEGRQSDKFYSVRLFQIEFIEHKQLKETKIPNQDIASTGGSKSRPFVYGKVNNFYALKLNYGFRRMLAGKPDPGTVSIHLVYSAGLAIGLEKPYYLDAYVPLPQGGYARKQIKYEQDTINFLTKYLILGSAGFSKGLNEIKIIPGVNARTGLHFDFATSRYTVLALETGLSAELYARPILLMANQKQSSLLFNGYISLQIGRRK